MKPVQNKTYRTRLEFDVVLQQAAQFAVSGEGKQRVLQSEPATELAEAESALQLTDCLCTVLVRGQNPGISDQDPLPAIAMRAEKGGVLSMGELLWVRTALRNARVLRSWYQPPAEKAYFADWLFSALYEDAVFERILSDSILSDTEMADDASSTLADIRRRIARAESSVRDKLDGIIRSASTAKYLQEAIVTMRGGRFVVPVKLENRGAIKGLVHDVSSSGNTVFIEPAAVVEANNKIMQLKAEEQQEIERILIQFSSQVQGAAARLKESHRAFVQIDCAMAKARYALQQDAQLPLLNSEGYVNLRKARHPLLDKKKAVPIDVSLGREYTTLVITGPNTGGKTVSLKTVGLHCLMAACGMLIPAAEGSDVAVFSRVLADIGDEQSIEQSLSTFSSHITNIVDILKVADDNSLVLLDELGAGTDPAEGAALAQAILERLRRMGCRVMATTHYGEIKLYAMETAGVQNASCEFDVASLRPTYRLSIGVPGRSNALLICERLGLDKSLLEEAREGMSNEDRRFEDVLADVDTLKTQLSEREAEMQALKEQAQQELQKAREDAAKLRKQGEKELDMARNRAKQLSADVASGAYKLIDELKKLEADDEKTRRERIARAKQIANNDSVKLADYDDSTIISAEELPRVKSVKKGDIVYVPSLASTASVMSEPDAKGYVQLQSGLLKTRAKVSDLRQPANAELPKPKKKYEVSKGIAKTDDRGPRTEINLLGLTVDEALLELERFIDSAVMRHLHLIYVIHGKGTGALRSGVQSWLRRCPRVKSFRLGQYGEGDAGVTVVELK